MFLTIGKLARSICKYYRSSIKIFFSLTYNEKNKKIVKLLFFLYCNGIRLFPTFSEKND